MGEPCAQSRSSARDGRSYDDLGVRELPWPNVEIRDPSEAGGMEWEVGDIVPAKVGSPVVGLVAVITLAQRVRSGSKTERRATGA